MILEKQYYLSILTWGNIPKRLDYPSAVQKFDQALEPHRQMSCWVYSYI